MKRVGYFIPRVGVQITGIVFMTQVVTEVIATRKQGFEWVLPASAIAFGLAVAAGVACVVWNSVEAAKQGGAK